MRERPSKRGTRRTGTKGKGESLPKRVAVVVTVPFTIRHFLDAQIKALCEHYDVFVIADVSSPNELSFLPEDANVIPVRIERKPSPLRDVKALSRLVRIFRSEQFDLVHSITPKAGLLAMTAAFISRVPHRIHTFQGEVWATRQGVSRWVLKLADRLTATLATDVLVVGHSERRFLIREGVIEAKKSRVLVNGSICGVDTKRFKPDPEARASVRRQLCIADDEIMFLFVGRLNRDKGIGVAIEAFRQLDHNGTRCHLVIVGPDEEGLSQLPEFTRVRGVRFVGESYEAERYMAAADVLCLPSRREGFAVVIIEAASVGIPAVASRIYGIEDTLVDGVTGLLHDVDNPDHAAQCMALVQVDDALRLRLGGAARSRAHRDFPRERLTEAVLGTYRGLLAEE
jgi:glycosyltransferase involved in cell wall biosynthesis